jgi:hypothetical protein
MRVRYSVLKSGPYFEPDKSCRGGGGRGGGGAPPPYLSARNCLVDNGINREVCTSVQVIVFQLMTLEVTFSFII